MDSNNNYFTQDELEWLKLRRGRFTSSEIWKLFVPGSRPMTEEELEARPKGPKGGLLDKRTTVPTMFGTMALTYIAEKAAEISSKADDDDILDQIKSEVRSLKWGKMYESEGVDHFKAITGKDVIYHGLSNPKFYEYGEFAGGSPDGDIIDESAILEMKCPVNGYIHSKRLQIKTIEDFKETHWNEYCQCQMNMHIMDKDYCYFSSYDPRRVKPITRTKIIKVPRCTDWGAEFDARLDAALGIMCEMIENEEKFLFIE